MMCPIVVKEGLQCWFRFVMHVANNDVNDVWGSLMTDCRYEWRVIHVVGLDIFPMAQSDIHDNDVACACGMSAAADTQKP